MAGAAKRARLDDADADDEESGSPADARDHLTKNSRDGGIVMRGLAELLESPFDWRFLRGASPRFAHVGGAPTSPLARSVDSFRAELEAWDAQRVHAEASKDKPDGDRVLFALRMRHLAGGRHRPGSASGDASRIETMLDAIAAMLKKSAVLGWPPVARGPWFSLRMLRGLDGDSEDDESEDDAEYQKKLLVDRGAVELIITMMEQWGSSAQVQERGCLLLSKLWGPEDLNRRCVLLIRQAMDAHLSEPRLQSSACKALKQYWYSQSRYLLSVDAFKAVGVAMERHPSSLRVQRSACDFFRRVSSVSSWEPEEDEDICESLRNTQVMKLVLSAATTHAGSKSFRRDAWILIAHLLRHIEDPSFFHCGGVSAMSAALSCECWGHFTDKRTFVMEAFRWACTYEESVRHIDENLMQVTLSLLIKQASDVDTSIPVDCCKVFGQLARHDRWAAWLSDRGVVEHIVNFMEGCLDIRSRADKVLYNSARTAPHELIESTSALTRLVRGEPAQVAGALRVVLKAMAAVPKELEVQVRGCAFVASLGWCLLNAVKASAFRACEGVLGAMAGHAKEEAVQEQGCLALATLLAHEDNQVVAAEHGGVGTLVQAMERFPSNAVIRQKGREIIKTMSKSAKARKHSAELRLVSLVS